MSSRDFLFIELYSLRRDLISLWTFSGAVVSNPPTSFGRRLYSPTANQSLRLSEVPDLSME